jgi:hypothetical protein
MPLKKIKDVNHWHAIKDQLGVLDNAVVKAGLTGSTKPEIVEYGTYNELGTSTIPARSFIRSTADKQRKKWDALADKLLGSVIDRKHSASKALDDLGKQAQFDIRKTINTLRTPPLSPKTIKRKKSTKPLINQGTMLNAIEYEVTKR